jgi:hypothetical protein
MTVDKSTKNWLYKISVLRFERSKPYLGRGTSYVRKRQGVGESHAEGLRGEAGG